MSQKKKEKRIPLVIDANYAVLPTTKKFYYARAFLQWLASVFLTVIERLFYGLQVTGREHLKGLDTGFITICNHVSTLDCGMVDFACKKWNIFFPTVKSNLEVPFRRVLLKHLGGMPIPNTAVGFKSFAKMIKSILKHGETVHLFPEGEFSPYCNKIREFKRGAFAFAYDCNVPILPLVITYHKISGIRKLFKHKPDLHIHILPPVYPNKEESRGKDVVKLMNFCFNQMTEFFEKESES